MIKFDDSIATNKVNAFLDTAFIGSGNNQSISGITKQQFTDAVQTALVDNTSPSSWFIAAGGLVLVLLATMELLDHWHGMQCLLGATSTVPSGRRRQAKSFALQIAGKLLVGLVLISLTALGNRGTSVELNDDYRFVGSRIWRLAIESWL